MQYKLVQVLLDFTLDVEVLNERETFFGRRYIVLQKKIITA